MMSCDFKSAYMELYGCEPDYTNNQTRALAAIYFRGFADGSAKPKQVIVYYSVVLQRYANSKPERIVPGRAIFECHRLTHDALQQIEDAICNDVEGFEEMQHRRAVIQSMAIL
jgi:hypothetical protein